MLRNKIKQSEKLIFLDIDGVLNVTLYCDYPQLLDQGEDPQIRYMRGLEPRCVKHLNDLIKDTNAKVVITSTWRRGRTLEELRKIFIDSGFEGEIIDVTGISDTGLRGVEIYEWMKENVIRYYEYNNYVIIDDDSDMLYWQKDNFYITDPFCGFTERGHYKCKQILNKLF